MKDLTKLSKAQLIAEIERLRGNMEGVKCHLKYMDCSSSGRDEVYALYNAIERTADGIDVLLEEDIEWSNFSGF